MEKGQDILSAPLHLGGLLVDADTEAQAQVGGVHGIATAVVAVGNEIEVLTKLLGHVNVPAVRRERGSHGRNADEPTKNQVEKHDAR